MNLHQVVSGVIAAVNPAQPVALRTSTGYAISPDGTMVPSYEMTAGASLTGSVAGGLLTATSVSLGALAARQFVMADGLALGTVVTGQVSGVPGGPGVYSVTGTQTLAALPMFATSLSGDVQELSQRDLRQLEGINVQGSQRSIYLNGIVSGVVRVTQQGGDLITLQDGSVWLTTSVLERWDVGWVKVSVTLQNGE